jgi:hypothetical protein
MSIRNTLLLTNGSNQDNFNKHDMSYAINCLTPKERSVAQILQLVARRSCTLPGDILIGCNALISSIDVSMLQISSNTSKRYAMRRLYDNLDELMQAQVLTLQYYNCDNMQSAMPTMNCTNIRTMPIDRIIFKHINLGNRIRITSMSFEATTVVKPRLIINDYIDMDSNIDNILQRCNMQGESML